MWRVDTCDNADGLGALDDMSIDHVITDPPYSKRTHKAVRRASLTGETGISRNVDLGFESLTAETQTRCAREFARIARRWILVFCDHEGSTGWREAFINAGLDYVRTGIWLKLGSTPQFTGDRPATGHECIVIAHRKGRKRWNGGGKHGVWKCPIVLNHGPKEARVHTTQKPLALMESLIRDFTDPGDLILDPFCGSGTTLVASRKLGRNAIGMERDPTYAEVARKRIKESREQTEMFPT